MGIQSGSAGGGILLFGEQPFQLGVLGRPVFLVGVKDICKTAPAYILRKHLLLLGGGTAMLLLQSAQGLDGFNIAGEFLLGASDTQIIIRDVKISCGFRHRFSVAHWCRCAHRFRQHSRFCLRWFGWEGQQQLRHRPCNQQPFQEKRQ